MKLPGVMRGGGVNLTESEHLLPINSTSPVLCISYAEPVYKNPHPPMRASVLLEYSVEQRSIKNIHAGELP